MIEDRIFKYSMFGSVDINLVNVDSQVKYIYHIQIIFFVIN